MWGEDTLQFELRPGAGGKHFILIDELPRVLRRGTRRVGQCHDRLAGLEPASDGWERRFPVYSVAVESALGPQEGPPTGWGALGRRENMADHRIGTREWLAAREDLLKREKEHTRLGDEIAHQRRDLPWVPVAKDYRFDTDEGEKSLEDLFDGRSQLLVYHFMFGPSYQAGCPVNSSIADSLDGALLHLHARDATLLLVSQAPLEKLQAYKRRMGWRLPWVSSSPDFNFDLGFSQTEEQSRQAGAGTASPPRIGGAWAVLQRGLGRVPADRRAERPLDGYRHRWVPHRAPGSAPSYETAMTSTTRTRRRGADWSSS